MPYLPLKSCEWHLKIFFILICGIRDGKAADPEGQACARFFYEYPGEPGLGHFIHTYVCDGNPVIPTFQGEPERVAMDNDMDAFAKMLWENLNEDNKISLYVRYTDIETGAYEHLIINKHE